MTGNSQAISAGDKLTVSRQGNGSMRDGKVLISGGLGFIGRCATRMLVERGHEVRLFDNLNPQVHGEVPRLAADDLLCHPHVEVYRGDVRNSADWATVMPGIGYVLHLAAETGTAQSMYEISRYTETNVSGISLLLQFLANSSHNVEKIVLASSRSVYGEGAYDCARCGMVYPPARSGDRLRSGLWDPCCPVCGGPITSAPTPENAELAPESIYAATKLAQEHLLRITSRALGLPAVILRMQNVYGEGQSLRNPYTGLMTIFAGQLQAGKTLNLFEDGQESRDFIHVDDAARALLLTLFDEAADGCTFNVGSGHAASVETVAKMLCSCFGVSGQYHVSGQFRLGDVRHSIASLTAIEERLGFQPTVSLEQGLERLVAWVRSQPIEPGQWDVANEQLMKRGLMPTGSVFAD
jgi:dTDP-L-rhamnose 4-epimerase